MAILVKLGERTYEFETMHEVTSARSMYAHCSCDQNGFEELLESEGIDFYVENEG